MSGINCIRLTFVYLYFSPNTFPKIQQNLGDQLEIRLNVPRCIDETVPIIRLCTYRLKLNDNRSQPTM